MAITVKEIVYALPKDGFSIEPITLSMSNLRTPTPNQVCNSINKTTQKTLTNFENFLLAKMETPGSRSIDFSQRYCKTPTKSRHIRV